MAMDGQQSTLFCGAGLDIGAIDPGKRPSGEKASRGPSNESKLQATQVATNNPPEGLQSFSLWQL